MGTGMGPPSCTAPAHKTQRHTGGPIGGQQGRTQGSVGCTCGVLEAVHVCGAQPQLAGTWPQQDPARGCGRKRSRHPQLARAVLPSIPSLLALAALYATVKQEEQLAASGFRVNAACLHTAAAAACSTTTLPCPLPNRLAPVLAVRLLQLPHHVLRAIRAVVVNHHDLIVQLTAWRLELPSLLRMRRCGSTSAGTDWRRRLGRAGRGPPSA